MKSRTTIKYFTKIEVSWSDNCKKKCKVEFDYSETCCIENANLLMLFWLQFYWSIYNVNLEFVIHKQIFTYYFYFN